MHAVRQLCAASDEKELDQDHLAMAKHAFDSVSSSRLKPKAVRNEGLDIAKDKAVRCTDALGAAVAVMDTMTQTLLERSLVLTLPAECLHMYAEFACYGAADFSATLSGKASILGFKVALPSDSMTQNSQNSLALRAPERAQIATKTPCYSGVCKTMQTKL
eukprot:8781289-Pyramimonas_sp.AAC.1